MVVITIRLTGETKDRIFDQIVLDPQISVEALRKKIENITNIPIDFQNIEFRGESLIESLTPLESINNFEQIVVNHRKLINWQTYIEMINEIKRMTTSGVTQERREIALKARTHLSPLYSSLFFVVYPTLAIEDMKISRNINFLIHNTRKYINRSVSAYFKALFPGRKVHLKDKPEKLDGIHIGVFVFVDGVARYYAKTIGSIPSPEEESDSPNSPQIDLMEIFVYILMKLIGIGPREVHIVPDTTHSGRVFIATEMISNFRTASGVAVSQTLEFSKETEQVLIDSEMKYQLKVLSNLLCLSDLQMNKGNFGIVKKDATEFETKEGNESSRRELRIVDFGVNMNSITRNPTIFDKTSDTLLLKSWFDKWDFLNNVYKARDIMDNDAALKNENNTNSEIFALFFRRLETALKKFFDTEDLKQSEK